MGLCQLGMEIGPEHSEADMFGYVVTRFPTRSLARVRIVGWSFVEQVQREQA